jgi:hypothetical protein
VMKNPISPLVIIAAICLASFLISCDVFEIDSPDTGIINSDSAKSVVADALVMSRLAYAGASAGYFTDHHPDLSSCSTGQVTILANDADALELIYGACRMGAVTWDGRIAMLSDENDSPYEIVFGDGTNRLRISQSKPTLTFPYIDNGEILTLIGDMKVYQHAKAHDYLMQDFNVFYNTCDVRILDGDLYIGYDDPAGVQEFIFSGEVYSNLLPDIECQTMRPFLAGDQSYPYSGVMLVTALDDGSNVFVIADSDASTVTLRIDSDNNSAIDTEIATTWNGLKNSADVSLQELFDYFW